MVVEAETGHLSNFNRSEKLDILDLHEIQAEKIKFCERLRISQLFIYAEGGDHKD